MFRVLRLGIILVFCLALSFMFACEGDEGPQGPQGDQGEAGTPGEDLAIATPSDFYVSMAVFNEFNGTDYNYCSQDFVKVTFDTTQSVSATQVVGVYLAKAPVIDGADGDVDEWGDGEDIFESHVTLTGTVGEDLMIDDVLFRCVYDSRYIYFFMSWEENSYGELEAVEDRNFMRWYNDGVNNFDPIIEGAEDRAWLMFLIDPDYIPGTSDCLLECDLAEASFTADQRIDVWDWRAALTDLVGYADDGYMIYDGTISDYFGDSGGPAFMRNESEGLPLWMYYNDPNASGDYPFWFRNAIPFVDNNWSKTSKIPGYMALVPFGDRADVITASAYETNKWIVEMKRLRNTGSGNDIQF